jgi:hypothetical protein
MSTITTSPSSQMGGKRKLSKWNKFTSKVYATEHRKNKNFKFKDALKMASAMKKKGQYGGGGAEDETFSTVPLNTTSEEDGSLAASQIGQELAGAPYGGRRRRRTMRRSRGRSRGRGRARASRRR